MTMMVAMMGIKENRPIRKLMLKVVSIMSMSFDILEHKEITNQSIPKYKAKVYV